MYSLRFLGCVRIEDPLGGAEAPLSQPRALALLACLGAAGPEGCTRDKLLGRFWPDLDTHHARHALAVQLHQIRRVLGRGAVLTPGDFVRLNPDIVSTDLADFQAAIRQGELERAADLYRGPFLDGFHLTGAGEFARWVDDERQRLAVQCLEVLESLATRAERAGYPAEAVAWWQRAAQHDPYNSRVALACAQAYAAAGDRGNGVQFLREHAKRLRVELEIEPDPELLDAIRTGDLGVAPVYASTTNWSALQIPPPAPSSPAPPSATAPEDPPAPRADSGPDAAPHPRSRPWPGRMTAIALVAVLALAGAMAVRARNGRAPNAGRVLVLPTESVGLDTSMATAVSMHLHAALAEWNILEVVSPAAGMEAWHAAAGITQPVPTGSDVRSLASRLGAGMVLRTRAASVSGGVELQASLAGTGDGVPLAAASATGPPDSIRASVEELLVHLLARVHGIPEDRIASLAAFDPAAVRMYVRAHQAEPAARTRLLREALARDTGFAPAAVALLDGAPDYYSQQREDDWHPIAAVAWRHRSRLSRADRAYVEALVGWRFIPRYTAAQHVGAWARAVEVAPDRMAQLRGFSRECYRWCSELYDDWTRRALAAHDALVERGLAEADFLEDGLELAFISGDSARLRRYAERLPDDALYGHWLVATALGRERESADLRRLMAQGEFHDMRVGNVAVLTGLGLEDAEMLARLDRKSGSPWQLTAQVVARERGRHAEYRALRDKMFQLGHTTARYDAFLSHTLIWEWAYFDEPETDSVLDGHARTLAEIINRHPRTAPDTLATAHCALAQLRLGRSDTTGVADAMAYLSDDPDARDLAVARICVPFLGLLAARGRGHDALTAATRRLDDVLWQRPLDVGTGGGMINVEIMLAAAANLELARTLLALGNPEVGLRAVARRPYHAGLWAVFGFHNEFVLEEARLWAAAGSPEAALDRYDRYFRLRPEPPDLPAWRTTWERARAERNALLSARDG